MTDIIEQCALASINSRLVKSIFDPLENLDDIPNADQWRNDARAVLSKFKELTAEPTDAMIYVGVYEVSDFLLEDEKAIACFKSMTEQMWKDIGI